MPVVSSVDGPNRRIYLSAETVGATVHPVDDIYKEVRALRRTDPSLRSFTSFLVASGNVAKGGGTFTERLVTCINGTRIVPYDATHELTINGTIITDDGQSGTACFDRSALTPTTRVDINYIPPQVEVIQVNTGSGVTAQDVDDIAQAVWNENL